MNSPICLPVYLPPPKLPHSREQNAAQSQVVSSKRSKKNKFDFPTFRLIFSLFIFLSGLLDIILILLVLKTTQNNVFLLDKTIELQNEIKSLSQETADLKNKILNVHDTKPLSHNAHKINGITFNDLYATYKPMSISTSTVNHNKNSNIFYKNTNHVRNRTAKTIANSIRQSLGVASPTEYSDDIYNNSNEQELVKDPPSKFDLCDVLSAIEGIESEDYWEICGEREHSAGRTKRSTRGNQTGRKSSKGRRGHNHKGNSTQGPVATHFKGGQPERFIQDGGSLVAPWHPDTAATENFDMSYTFREGKGSVEVSASGLYMIYAQVYYLTSEVINSFTINIREKGKDGKPIAFCSSNAVLPNGKGVTEVSCYTSVIRYLNATNEVYLTQRDRNRRMILRDGHSFLGLVKLNSLPESRPKRSRKN